MKKRYGTIQIDLDGLWTNLSYYGHSAPLSPDPFFSSAIPRFLELFDKFNIKATFFLIGRDALVKEKKDLIKEIIKKGHEIANHTYNHPFGLRTISYEKKMSEIEKCEKIIKDITGKKPLGFKAPGYDLDPQILSILSKKGYLYDSSMIPTFTYPLIMRAVSFISSTKKRTHGPKLHWLFAPNYPYHPSYKSEWKKGLQKILELPCTVTPFFRLPFHATFALKFGFAYFTSAYKLARFLNLPLNYEFHAADLADDIPDKKLFYLKNLPLTKRKKICYKMLKMMSKDYNFITSAELAQKIKDKELKKQ